MYEKKGLVVYGRFIKRRTTILLKQLGETTEIAEERFNGIKTVHNFGQIAKEELNYSNKVDQGKLLFLFFNQKKQIM